MPTTQSRLTVTLSRQLEKRLAAAAQQENLSKSGLAARILSESIDRRPSHRKKALATLFADFRKAQPGSRKAESARQALIEALRRESHASKPPTSKTRRFDDTIDAFQSVAAWPK